ncbi:MULTISPECIES: hypothetical protein [Pseudomonas]|uniref:hypothetical protein n=1 Tax=Pseudomonas TaxID=286 RepID=UPI00210B0CCF|nr:hypothetical protein [Pseudomonas sp. 06C 126]
MLFEVLRCTHHDTTIASKLTCHQPGITRLTRADHRIESFLDYIHQTGQGQAAKEKADDLAENEGCAVLLTTLLVGCALREVVVPILFDGSSYSIGSPTGVWRCQKTSRAI